MDVHTSPEFTTPLATGEDLLALQRATMQLYNGILQGYVLLEDIQVGNSEVFIPRPLKGSERRRTGNEPYWNIGLQGDGCFITLVSPDPLEHDTRVRHNRIVNSLTFNTRDTVTPGVVSSYGAIVNRREIARDVFLESEEQRVELRPDSSLTASVCEHLLGELSAMDEEGRVAAIVARERRNTPSRRILGAFGLR